MIQKMVPQNFEMITKDYEASGEKPQVMNAEDACPLQPPNVLALVLLKCDLRKTQSIPCGSRHRACVSLREPSRQQSAMAGHTRN